MGHSDLNEDAVRSATPPTGGEEIAMSKGSPTIALRLRGAERQRLEQIAARDRRLLSDVARAAVEQYLRGQEPSASEEQPTPSASVRKKPRRPPSRPARLTHLLAEAQALLQEYTSWRDALPEFAQDSPTAELLESAIDGLEAAYDALASIEPPRGFGRD